MTEVKKFKKGQLKYFLSCRPFEIVAYSRSIPEDTAYVLLFAQNYRYNYQKMKWVKDKR